MRKERARTGTLGRVSAIAGSTPARSAYYVAAAILIGLALLGWWLK